MPREKIDTDYVLRLWDADYTMPQILSLTARASGQKFTRRCVYGTIVQARKCGDTRATYRREKPMPKRNVDVLSRVRVLQRS